MFDKFKSPERKKMEAFMDKNKSWGSYQHFFDGTDLLITVAAIMMMITASIATIVTLGANTLDFIIVGAIIFIMGYLIFLVQTE